MLASSYPLLDVFFSMIWFFVFVLWIWLLISIVFDIFRSHDMGGLAKALWLLFIIVLPFLGVLVYLIARGGQMHERTQASARSQEESLRAYVRQTAGGSTASELETLARLHDAGKLSDDDFERAKAKVLG
jgi:ABC-type multidrug transport system fused ATPase/permease subunit